MISDLDLLAAIRQVPTTWPFRTALSIDSDGVRLSLSIRRRYQPEGHGDVLTGGWMVMIPQADLARRLPKTTTEQGLLRACKRMLTQAPSLARLKRRRLQVGIALALAGMLPMAREHALASGRTLHAETMTTDDCQYWEDWLQDALCGR